MRRRIVNYNQSYKQWARRERRIKLAKRRQEIMALLNDKVSWDVISRFREAQQLLRLVYRRQSSSTRSINANAHLVLRDGMVQGRAKQVLQIPTRHGTVTYRTNTRGMDTQRIRKKRGSNIREVHMNVAWEGDSYELDSPQVAQEIHEDVASYLTDTLKWGGSDDKRLLEIEYDENGKVLSVDQSSRDPLPYGTTKLEPWQGKVGNQQAQF